MPTNPQHDRRTAVDRYLCMRIRTLIRLHGQQPTAKMLGIGLDSLLEIKENGSLMPATIQRVRDRLEVLDAHT